MKNEVTVVLTDEEYEFLKRANIYRPNLQSYTIEELIKEIIARATPIEISRVKDEEKIEADCSTAGISSTVPAIVTRHGKIEYNLFHKGTFTFSDTRYESVSQDMFDNEKEGEDDDTRTNQRTSI